MDRSTATWVSARSACISRIALSQVAFATAYDSWARPVQSLRSGESETALAGGVNLLLDRTSWTAVSRAHMLSPGGRCRTFSADADGFARDLLRWIDRARPPKPDENALKAEAGAWYRGEL